MENHKTNGFGKWKLLNRDHLEIDTKIGIIDLERRIFFETDMKGNSTGYNLLLDSLGGFISIPVDKKESEDKKQEEIW